MKWYVLVFASCLTLWSAAQSQFSTTEINYGAFGALADRYQDMSIKNTGSKPIYILRVEHGPSVTHFLPSDRIEPGGTLIVRFQVNPTVKGKFSFPVQVFTSDLAEPKVIQLKGELLTNPGTGFNYTACPDFNNTPSLFRTQNLTIITVDKVTSQPLSQSKVVIVRNGEKAGAWLTGKKGSFQAAIPSGYFFFLVNHEGYLTKQDGVFVGPEITEITIPLVRDPKAVVPIPVVDVPDTATVIPPAQVEELIEEVIPPPPHVDSVIKQANIELATLPLDAFGEDHFKPVNAVFVLDVSSSMKLGQKMDLMKYSLNELVSKMRSNDKIGLVTYSDEAVVFKAPTSGSQKDELAKSVNDLRPQGLTAGGKGIKLGYKQVLKNYDPTKANMVIVITDGAFNKDSDDYQKLVKKYSKKGITLSVVGIEAKDRDAKLMTEAASFGKGRYVPIKELSDAQHNLFQEIRIASFKGV